MQAAAVVFGLSRAVNDAFDETLRRRESQVLRTAFRMLGNWPDAEDVGQEVFLRLHRHGLDFASDHALTAWIYRVTVNLCMDRLRSARCAVELPELPSREPSAETGLLREEEKRWLRDALAALPARERAAVTLREIEGLSTAEVAEILGSSQGTVRSQVSTALEKLRKSMGRRIAR